LKPNAAISASQNLTWARNWYGSSSLCWESKQQRGRC